MRRKLNRSDRVWVVSSRGLALSHEEASRAWGSLMGQMADMSVEVQMPKFNDLLKAIRRATLDGKES